jgi:phosphatidylglycerol:prolipoprotein diacylglycerol transferase
VLPTLFHIGPVAVHSYGTLLMVAFFSGILLARREARRLGVHPDLALDLGTWTLVAAIVFARAAYVALNWSDFAPHPVEALYIWRQGGLTFHGGLLGGVLAALLLAHRRRVSTWLLADMSAPGLALGYAIARIGCFLNGCCYGGPTRLPWGVRFPLFPDSPLTTDPSHPTQIYAALGSLVILAVLLRLRSRLPGRGQLFLVYLMLYSVMRSAIEVLRKGYTAWPLLDGLTQAQVASAVIFLAALVIFVRRSRPAQPSVPQKSDSSK